MAEDAPMTGALAEILAAFDLAGEPVQIRRWGGGHINDTFRVLTRGPAGEEGPDYILQRISPVAFRRPDQVMANIQGVTGWLRERIRAAGGDPDRETLRPVPARDGALFHRDRRGDPWRVFPFVRDTACYETAETPALFAEAGRAFGRFQRLLDGYPAGTLYETIPRFHDTEDRLRRLRAAVAADAVGRAGDCGAEIRFALDRAADCSVVLDAQRAGALPLRVTHNDTKLSNVLFDARTGAAVCVIDLDTVMPGLSVNDFGDSIRSGASRCAEDEEDLDRVALDLDLFRAYTAAFLEEAGDILTAAEVDYLPWGARLMTLECGIRFLTDHLEGDVYFRTRRPGQNLARARTQFRLVWDMERRWEEMEAVIRGAG